MPTGVYTRTKEHLDKIKQQLSVSRNPQKARLKLIGRKHSEETKKKMSISAKGKNTWAKGRVKPLSERINISNKLKGSQSHLWKGGVTSINSTIRHSLEYRLWRESVFKRDNYTCIWCKRRGVVLNADHIKPFAYYPELRFAIDNGRTLCVPCHKTTDTYKKKDKR